MKSDSCAQELSGIVLANDPAKAVGIVQVLVQRGINARVETDPESLLMQCRTRAPNIAIVEDRLPAMTGARFLADLLRVSWTTSTILVSDEKEDAVHEKTEGLGILGSIRNLNDIEGLNRLLDVFFEMVAPKR